LDKLKTLKYESKTNPEFQLLNFQKNFDESMEDDFNTPKAIAVIFDLINEGNSLLAENKLSEADAKDISKFLRNTDEVFGFIFGEKIKEKIPAEIIKLVEEREKCRKQGLWKKSDEIRNEIEKSGYRLEDTKGGPKIKKIS